MRALTVQQPWAWAIIHGGKDVENRTQAWSYRGPLAIHAGARLSDRGVEAPLVQRLFAEAMRADSHHALDFGAIIGVVDLIAAHVAETLDRPYSTPLGDIHAACCASPWAETSYREHGGRTRREIVHLVLRDPRPLDRPIPCRGRLGLWTPPPDTLDELRAVLA